MIVNQAYHSHNSRQSLNPHIKSYDYKSVVSSFIRKAPDLWSKVPLPLRNGVSKTSFSKRMKKHIYANY